jgi:hypothetical protein
MAARRILRAGHHHYYHLRWLPKVNAVADPLRDDSLSTVKAFEHLGYGRACAAQVVGEHPRSLPNQSLEEGDRLLPGCYRLR